VHRAPGIPRALFSKGDEIFRRTSGVTRREIAKSYLIAVLFETESVNAPHSRRPGEGQDP
jgi:hypothetical protein